MNKKVKFKRWVGEAQFAKYENGNNAIRIVEENGEPIATASVNLEQVLPADRVYIKDWSENEGMLFALIDAGIVEDTGIIHPIGYVDAVECKIFVDVQ